jgi:GTP-binding protein HflX
VLLHVGLGRRCHEDETQEFRALADSAGAVVASEIDALVPRANPRFFIGAGKAEEVAATCARVGADIVLVNQALSPSQERNLERLLETRVLDRNGLILDIFAQRASSFEGKLQVELAQLEHLSTRLVRGWTHLERQKGGIGLRGPGEAQLETDRRLIGHRIKRLRSRLERVERQRAVSRRERRRHELPTIALVGYTNAGKTTLFNALSGASLEAKDQLFATLDPTVRKIALCAGETALVVDTVGFVRDLPHELVAAFRATLTETREASLLLHVIDASDPHYEDRCEQVEAVLAEIGAADVATLRVYNKVDAATAERRRELQSADNAQIGVSAFTGEGIDALTGTIGDLVVGRRVHGRLKLAPEQARARAKLFGWRAVRSEAPDDVGGWTLDVELTAKRWRELCATEGLAEDSVRQEV